MNTIKVSIIIPVYNTEKYLSECLDSLMNQSLKEIEIIIVNDGSTDKSIDIIERFSNLDKRIIVINKKNEGQAVARNLAISLAKGEYIGFVDSDDWIDLNMFEHLYSQTLRYNSPDLILCEFRLFNEQNNKYNSPKWTKIPFDSKYDKITFTFDMVKSKILEVNTGPFNKIYKRSFIVRSNLQFSEGCYYEDIVFVIRALLNANNICYLRKDFYTYRFFRVGSISSDSGLKHFDIFIVLNQLIEKLTQDSKYDKIEDELQLYIFNTYLYHFYDINSKLKRAFWKKIAYEFYKLNNDIQIHLLERQKILKTGIKLGFFPILIISYCYRIYNYMFKIFF